MIRLHLLGALELAASDGRDLHPLVAQPKRLAVLAYLAARPAGEFVRRDTLLGVFWPELDQGAARRSLRQALHVIRTHLGTEALSTRGDDDVAVNPAAVVCDVPEFLAAVSESRLDEASDAYRGDLLAGFFLSGGPPAFDQWLETERERLRTLAARSVWSLADAAEQAGDRSAAANWARRAAALTADDELVLRRLIQLLLRVGDRAGALHAYDAFARRLARDFGEQPAAQTRALVAGLGGIPAAPPAPLADVPPPRRRASWLAPAGALAAVVVFAAAARTLLGRRAEPPVLAVGEVIRGDSTVPDLAVRTLPELLATDLAQVGGLRVISQPRLEEVAAQVKPAGQPTIAVARAAGADELLEGELYRRGVDSLRLDLRRVDARTGVVRNALTLRGRDAFALADSAAAWFASRLGLAAPERSVTEVTSGSLVAHGLYDEGLRTYYRAGDYRGAARLFQSALDQDSTFAMAAYYLGRSIEVQDPSAGEAAFALAARLARHASEREALLIRVQWPAAQNEPGWVALAESLGARYPDEPEGRYAEGMARSMDGDFAGAGRAFAAAVVLDSLSLVGPRPRCLACDAYEHLITNDIAIDSAAAALRDAREWLLRMPHSPRAWELWGDALERQERLPEALAARDTAGRLRGSGGATIVDRAYFLIRGGDLEAADRLLASTEEEGPAAERDDARWWHVIELRYAGRPRAAAQLARRLVTGAEGHLDYMPLGAALLEAGDYGGAGRAFDAAGLHSEGFRRDHPGIAARHRAWALAQRATVAAAANDTAALRALVESVTVQARASAFGRDRRLPAYTWGLLLEHSGHLEAAVDSFRAAVFSLNEGYTRVNLELARTLLALGRAPEAVPWLQAVLRGGIESSNYFLTRTDAHELLARSFAAAGRPDSARAHYAWVARAWAHAEPEFAGRISAAREYLGEASAPKAAAHF